MKIRYYILHFLILASCKADKGALLFHESTKTRVFESINDISNIPTSISIDTNDFNFAVFGDIHITEENIHFLREVSRDTTQVDIDFCLVIGDLTDNGLEIEYENSHQSLHDMNIPFYSTIGNHDLYNKKGWEYWKQYYGPSCYSVNFDNYFKVIFLDSAEGLIGKTQFEWLENELKNNNSKFTFIASHYGLFDDITPYIWRLPSSEERYKLISLMCKYNVDTYLAGHLHAYQYTEIGDIKHFITGSMSQTIDKGTNGYVLFTIKDGVLSWQKVEV